MRPRPRILVLALLAVALVGCAAAGGATDSGYGAAEATSPPATSTTQPRDDDATGYYSESGAADHTSGQQQLQASGFAWSRTDLTARAGAPVVLTVSNDDQALHNFTLQAAGVAQDLAAAEVTKVRFTAPAAGTYRFFCKYHRGSMVGTLTVQ
jgi:plastocyanin